MSAVRDMFGRIAPRYDLLNRALSARRDLAWRRAALGLLAGRPERVLDLACGTFDLGLQALASGRAGRVHGCDFCLPMLQAGSAKRAGRPLSACCGDALHLPYPDGAFDAALVAYGWRNFPDPQAALAELARVLRPDGQLLVLEFFRPTAWWPRAFSATFGRCVFPLAGGLLAGDAAAYRYLRESTLRFLSLDEALAALAAAGFAAPRVRSFLGGVSHAIAARRATGA